MHRRWRYLRGRSRGQQGRRWCLDTTYSQKNEVKTDDEEFGEYFVFCAKRPGASYKEFGDRSRRRNAKHQGSRPYGRVNHADCCHFHAFLRPWGSWGLKSMWCNPKGQREQIGDLIRLDRQMGNISAKTNSSNQELSGPYLIRLHVRFASAKLPTV